MKFKRAELRRAQAADRKAKSISLKHQVTLAEREGMPLETSADALIDSAHTTRPFRKECFRSRQNVYAPTATRRAKADRKVGEMNFSQLCRAFERSYAKRFKHLPNMFKRIKGTDENAEKLRQFISSAIVAHDKQIIRVNTEIAKRHAKHIAAAGRALTEARLW